MRVFRAIAFVSLLGPYLCGCLVIDDLDLPPEEDCPPEIVAATSTPQNWLVQTIRVDPDGTGSTEFSVEIRDCSPTQRLEVKWALDLRPDDGGAERRLLSTVVEAANRADHTFELQHSDLLSFVGTCHRLHMLVSSDFQLDSLQPEPPANPEDPPDLDIATWTLAITDDEGTAVNCQMVGQTPGAT